jgi:uncharacterized DUF497 family protein
MSRRSPKPERQKTQSGGSPPLGFEWDERKAVSNERKHGVAFVEASTAFADKRSLDIRDEIHSSSREERWIMVARSSRGRLLTVSYTERGDNIRVSARGTSSPVRGKPMKRARKRPLTDPGDEEEMAPFYDMRGGVRGKHAKRYAAGIKVVLDPDVATEFPTSEMVNDALRLLIQLRHPSLGRPRRS